MINSPAFSPGHPDRSLDCEMSAEDEFRSLADRMEAAGWSANETATALLTLALNHALVRQAPLVRQAGVAEARRKSERLSGFF